MFARRRCSFCHRWFYPHPRLKQRQKTCGQSDCRRKQKQKSICEKRCSCRQEKKSDLHRKHSSVRALVYRCSWERFEARGSVCLSHPEEKLAIWRDRGGHRVSVVSDLRDGEILKRCDGFVTQDSVSAKPHCCQRE